MTCTRILLAAVLAAGLAPAARGQEGTFLGKDTVHWLGRLREAKADDRARAAFALGKIGEPGAGYSIKPLVQLLGEDKDPAVRDAAAFALGEIELAVAKKGQTAWSLTREALLKALKDDPDPRVRRSAAFAIGAAGRAALPARDELRQALVDGQPMVRKSAAWALGQLGPQAGPDVVNSLCRALADGNALVKREAAGALGEIGRMTDGEGKPLPHPGAPRLLELATAADSEATLQHAALHALVGVIGPEDKALAARLTDMLRNARDRDVVRAAALALANIGGAEADPAVPFLGGLLRDPDPKVRGTAAAALANARDKAAPAVPDLARILDDRDPTIRRNAALALANVGPQAATAVPALGKLLRSGGEDVDERRPTPDAEARRYAAEAMIQVGKAMEDAVPDIVHALKNEKYAVARQRAVWSLHNLPSLRARAEVLPALTEVLNDPSDRYFMARYDAARVLAEKLNADAPPKTVEVLLQMLRDRRVRIYGGSGAAVRGGPGEKIDPGAQVEQRLGRDARFLAAISLAELRSLANRKEVLDALEDSANWNDPETNKLNPEMRDRCQQAARVIRSSR